MVLCILAYDGHCVMVLQVAAQKYEGNMVLLSSTTHRGIRGVPIRIVISTLRHTKKLA